MLAKSRTISENGRTMNTDTSSIGTTSSRMGFGTPGGTIEFISTFIVRPFSLAVRLFANMLAGHLILVTFATICAAVWAVGLSLVILPFSFALLVALTGFEILVAFLQAFIFTILTAVYIGGSMHPEH